MSPGNSDLLICWTLCILYILHMHRDVDDVGGVGATGIYKNVTRGLMSDALCDEVDLSQFCQHVSLLAV